MAPTNVGYSFKEAISHFFRNWTTSLGAVITIFLSLFIIGLFIMGSAVLNSVIGTVEDQVVINAFISDDADQADVQAFEAELKTWSNVKSVTYKDKDDAKAEYSSKMSGNADATMSALDGQNPLPASFAIEMDDPSKVESTAEKLKKDADFQKIVDDGDVNASVLYGQEAVSRLFQVTNYIRIAAVVLDQRSARFLGHRDAHSDAFHVQAHGGRGNRARDRPTEGRVECPHEGGSRQHRSCH